MKHEIRLEDFEKWLNEHPLILYASGSGKRLYATATGGFEIHIKGVVIWRGTDARKAVMEYNYL